MKNWKKRALELFLEADVPNKTKIAEIVGKPRTTVRDFLNKHNIQGDVVTQQDKPNILLVDIETSKIMAYVWGLFNQNITIDNIVEDWYIICWSAKWYHDDIIMNSSVHDFGKPDGVERFRENEKLVVQAVWKLLDKADVVIAHNLKKFDKKKINAKFFEYGLPEPSPYKVIDTLLIARGNFALTSNKLDYITKMLNNGGKHKTDEQLWRDCMADDVEQLDRMQLYCDHDVVELENVWEELRPWDKNSPNLSLFYNDDVPRCNCCGSSDLKPLEDKFAHTNVSKFSLVQCGNCNKILRDRTNILTKDKRQSLMMNVR